MGPALMERQPETFKPPEHYSVPNPPHGVKVKVEVMQRVKGCRVHLAGEEEMPQIRARGGAAGVAVACRIRRAVVLGVARVLDVDAALAGEELAVPAVARRQDAVEHVDAARHRLDQI